MNRLQYNFLIIVLIVGFLLASLFWSRSINNNLKFHPVHCDQKKTFLPSLSSDSHRKKGIYNFLNWEKMDENQTFRFQLRRQCRGLENAIVTQSNSPLGSELVCDGEKSKRIKVTPQMFNTFVKSNFFSTKTLETCAVVGNGGILSNASCGKMIDSAQFVIRFNLPPLSSKYEKQAGSKTDLVTANPSIFSLKYHALKKKQNFVEDLQAYGRALLFIPAFSFCDNKAISLQAFHVTKNSNSSVRPIFMNPVYLREINRFWNSQGLNSRRASSGLMMISLAMELCAEVHVYGFWPFAFHPTGTHLLMHHYYDNVAPLQGIHSMPTEFMLLLKLHNQGVLRLHLDDCEP